MRTFDAIVIGLGGIGGAAAYHLACRGLSVLGVDQFGPAHDRGSSHGQTRLFRTAYFEHADYVPLLKRAAQLWKRLEQAQNVPLFARTGVLLAGPTGSGVIEGAAAAAASHRVNVEQLTAAAVMNRWPAFQVPADWTGLFEPEAGCLFVEACVQTHLAAAAAAGAELRFETQVQAISCNAAGIQLQIETERLAADRLVFCPGPWAGQLLPLPGLTLTVLRKSLFWYRPATASRYTAEAMPCFGADTRSGFFYATPAFDFRGVKVAEHTGGQPLENPAAVQRAIDRDDQTRVEGWTADMLPGLGTDRSGHATCFYTMTPDGHAVVGLHPDHPRVAIAGGFSGHGFKFAPVVGEALADLCCHGLTGLPIGFLSPGRFANG